MVIISEIKIQMNPRTKAIPVNCHIWHTTINSCSCWLNQYHHHQMSLNNRLCKVSTFKTIYMTTDALSSTCDIPRQQTSPRTQRRQRQTSQAWSRCSLLAWTRNVQICVPRWSYLTVCPVARSVKEIFFFATWWGRCFSCSAHTRCKCFSFICFFKWISPVRNLLWKSGCKCFPLDKPVCK